MRDIRSFAAVSLIATAALLTAGCGLKPGVAPQYVAADGTIVNEDGQVVAPDGTILDAGVPGGAVVPGGAGNPSAAPGSINPTTGPSGTSTAPAASGPVDRTGVTDTTIKIGLHAPVTGAAAIPQTSFERAVHVYFDSINAKGGIYGRKVEIIFRDDHFDPNTARTECKDLAEQEKVFLLIGGAGADQIDACARYAASVGVPYFSGGVHETRPSLGALSSLPTYFAVSLSYEQQVPLLTRLLTSDFKGQKWGLIVADNDSLNAFYDRALAGGKQAAGDPALARRIPKSTSSDAPTIATQICSSGAKVVIWNASPSSFINVTKSMACSVKFIGPGLTNGLNIVTTAACPSIAGSMFYSPMPGLDVMRQNSEFTKAYDASTGGQTPDDIGAAMYGLTKTIGLMLQSTGKDLSRQSLMSTVARVRTFNSGVFPATNFTGRFGGTAMHLLQADCNAGQWVTRRQNERP
jgi:ABC-type branched-subunit amino acid transport system substrate-binding protein